MQRRVTLELLDDDLGTPEEVAASLKDLRHINAWFGGMRTSVVMLKRVASQMGSKRLSLLEIGSGGGDVPMSVKQELERDGLRLDVTLLDRRHTHLPGDGADSVTADAMRMPFADNSFDVVSSSLLAHHFDPLPLQDLCRECLRVARHAVAVNDLIRSPIHLVLVYFGLPLFRSRLTWHDAPASVRAAYSVSEMERLLKPLGAHRVEISRHFLFRMGAILWK